MKTLIRTAFAVVLTLGLLAVAATRYTHVACVDDTTFFMLDRQRISADLSTAAEAASRLNDWMAEITASASKHVE